MLKTTATLTQISNLSIGGESCIRLDVLLEFSGLVSPVDVAINLAVVRVRGTADNHLNWPDHAGYGRAANHETFGPPNRLVDDQTIPHGSGKPAFAATVQQLTPAAALEDIVTIPAATSSLKVTKIMHLTHGGYAYWPADLFTPPNPTLQPADWRILGKVVAPENRLLVVNRFASNTLTGFTLGAPPATGDSYADWSAWESSPAGSAFAAASKALHPPPTGGLAQWIAPNPWFVL